MAKEINYHLPYWIEPETKVDPLDLQDTVPYEFVNFKLPLLKFKGVGLTTTLNPYQPEEESIATIREKLKNIRGSLVEYFANIGIVPKFDIEAFKYEGGVVDDLVEKVTGFRNKDGIYQIKTDHTYRLIELPGMGYWDVIFDYDQDNKVCKAFGTHPPSELGHGLGLIIQQEPWNEGERRWSGRTFAFWENGDTFVPGGSISLYSGGFYYPHYFNTEHVLVEALKLESALTGKPLPPELLPPQKPTIFGQVFGVIRKGFGFSK